MPTCSKCGRGVTGYPRPWGPSCVWNGEPVIPKDVEEHGGKELAEESNRDKANGDKDDSQAGNSSPLPSATGSQAPGKSPMATQPPSEVEPRLEGKRDEQIEDLTRQLTQAAQKIAQQDQQKDEQIRIIININANKQLPNIPLEAKHCMDSVKSLFPVAVELMTMQWSLRPPHLPHHQLSPPCITQWSSSHQIAPCTKYIEPCNCQFGLMQMSCSSASIFLRTDGVHDTSATAVLQSIRQL